MSATDSAAVSADARWDYEYGLHFTSTQATVVVLYSSCSRLQEFGLYYKKPFKVLHFSATKWLTFSDSPKNGPRLYPPGPGGAPLSV